MKLDRTRDFATICGEPHQPPEFDRPVKFEQDGRSFDVHGDEIIPRRRLVRSGANIPVGNGVSSRRQEAITKEYESLLKLFGGMARGPYKWDRGRVRDAVALIVEEASALGLRVDEKVIFKLLGQAAQLIPDWSGRSGSPFGPPTSEDRDILLQLVGVTAKGGYGWCPAQARSKTATEIHNDVIVLGLSIDIDTVRKFLKLAADLLSRSAKP